MRVFNRMSFNKVSQLLWIVAIALVIWTLSKLPLDTFIASINALKWQQWSLWIFLNILFIAITNFRWWLLIRMLKRPISFGWLMTIKQAGQAVSFITPGPQFGGEPLQIFWLHRRGVPLHKALLSLGLDRLYEVIINMLVLVTAIAILLYVSPTFFNQLTLINISKAPKIIGILLAILIVTVALWAISLKHFWLGSRLQIQLQKLIARWAQHPYLSDIKNYQQAFISDFRAVIENEKPTLIIAIILSIVSWLVLLGELDLLLAFMGINLNLQEFLVILVALRVAILLPIPAGIGTLEAAIYWAFVSLQLPTSAALGFIALIRIRDLLVLVSGLACWKWIQFKCKHKITPNAPTQTANSKT